jgi:hypothetical protein
MDKRIKELKHQASLWCDKNIPEQYSEETNSYGTAWEDKFAELIVQECASIDFRHKIGLTSDQDYDISDTIKQHFGVE